MAFLAVDEKEFPTPLPPPKKLSPSMVVKSENTKERIRQWLSFTPDGKALFALRSDGTLRLLDCANYKEIRSIKLREANAAAFNGGRKLAIAEGSYIGSFLTVHDLIDGKQIFRLDDRRLEVRALAFNGDGSQLAVATDALTVKICDLVAGRTAQTLHQRCAKRWAGRDTITSLDFSLDGRQLAVAFSNGVLTVWDLSKGTQVFSRDIYYRPGTYTALPIGTHGWFAWNALDLVCIQTWDMAFAECGVRFRPDGKQLAWVGGEYDKVRMLNAADGKELARLCPAKFTVFTSDGRKLLLGGSTDLDLRKGHENSGGFVIWNATKMRPTMSVVAGFDHWLQDFVATPDGRHVAAALGDGTIKVWDIR